MRTLKPWAIIAGVLIGTVGSVAVGVVYVLAIFTRQIASDLPPSDSALGATHWAVIEILAFLAVAIGGFTAAHMAKAFHVRHGTAVGVSALVVWLLVEWASPSEGPSAWYESFSFVSSVPAGALGGYVASKRANGPSALRAQ